MADVDVEAESPCGVSTGRGDNLMIQTQTAIACETVKNKLSMANDMTNTSDQIMLVITGFASSGVGACLVRRRKGCFSNEQVAGLSASSRGIGCNFYWSEVQALSLRCEATGESESDRRRAGLRITVGEEGS